MKRLCLALLFLLCASDAFGAWAEISSRRGSTAGNTAEDYRGIVLGSAVAVGDFCVAIGAVFGTSPDAITVTDDVGTTYSVFTDGNFTSNVTAYIATGTVTTAGTNTIWIDPVTDSYISGAATCFSGADTSPLDVGATGTFQTGVTNPSASITTTTANDLILALLVNSGSGSPTITPNASYTEIGETEDGACCATYSAVFRIVTTATSYTVDWTLSAANNTGVYPAAYKPSTAVAGAQIRHSVKVQ